MTATRIHNSREARFEALRDRADALTEYAWRQMGYSHASCCVCGYQQPISHYLYSGDRCPAFQADDSACDGTLVLAVCQ
jgi:hypothetical protein